MAGQIWKKFSTDVTDTLNLKATYFLLHYPKREAIFYSISKKYVNQ